LKWLTSGGVLRTEGEINSKDCKYALDTKGEKYVKLLLKEEKFLEIQKKMGDAQ